MFKIEDLRSDHIKLINDALIFKFYHNDSEVSHRYHGLGINTPVTVSVINADKAKSTLSSLMFEYDTELVRAENIPLINLYRNKYTSVYRFELDDISIELEVAKGIPEFEKLILGNSYNFSITADMS